MKHATRARPRALPVFVAALLVIVAVVMPAYAAAPANDSIRSARRITSIPTSIAQSTRQATSDSSDGKCVLGASVWYRYRPISTTNVRVVTFGSDYDTVLAVFTGSRSSRSLLKCRDDSGFSLASAAGIHAVPGTTYWIALSACCSPRARGGQSLLQLYRPRPAGVSTTIEKVETGAISGRLFVSGTTQCNTPSAGFLGAQVSQRVGDNVARGGGSTYVDNCGPDGASWTIALDSETGWAFQPGAAVVTATSETSDGFSDLTTEESTTMTVGSNPNLRAP